MLGCIMCQSAWLKKTLPNGLQSKRGRGFSLDHLKCFIFLSNGNKFNDCNTAKQVEQRGEPEETTVPGTRENTQISDSLSFNLKVSFILLLIEVAKVSLKIP